MAGADSPSKSKKTWGQRLKLTKGDSSKSAPDPIYGTVTGMSALSRSMKYAETWLYGTVRGAPLPPPVPAFPELAVLMCSCPDYLTGTKRMLKKPSICKKCKGSRLPIGGTVRAPPPPNMVMAGTIRGGTQRPVVKVRPTILNLHSPSDPYDFMRRSRLVSPEVKDNVSRSRAKSTSPTRGRTEMRNNLERDRSRSASRTREAVERRSILECNVNPYDLLDEDKNDSDSLQNEVFDEVTGEMRYRKASSNSIRSTRTKSLIECDRDLVLAKEKAELRNKKTKSNLDISKSYSVNKKSNEDIETKNILKITGQLPTRPPRRLKVDSSDENESDQCSRSEDSSTKLCDSTLLERIHQGSQNLSQEQELQQAIKSILKKPREGSIYSDTDSSSVGTPLLGSQNENDNMSPDSTRLSPAERKSSSSHFYLPTPQAITATKASRKKVQFSVENETRVEGDLNTTFEESSISPAISTDESSCNKSYAKIEEKQNLNATSPDTTNNSQECSVTLKTGKSSINVQNF